MIDVVMMHVFRIELWMRVGVIESDGGEGWGS